MNYTALHTEIQTDPDALSYAPFVAAGAHNQVAALLNEPRYPGPGMVPITTVLIWAAKYGVLAKLRAATQSGSAELASIAEVGLLLVSNPNIPAVDLALPDVQQMFGVLVAAGVIAADERDELFAYSIVMRSRADVLGLGTVQAGDVAQALAEVGDD